MRAISAIVIFLVGVVAIVVGIIYLTHSAHAIPSFFPGHVKYTPAGKKTKHGIAALVAGGVLILIAAAVAATGARTRRYSSSAR